MNFPFLKERILAAHCSTSLILGTVIYKYHPINVQTIFSSSDMCMGETQLIYLKIQLKIGNNHHISLTLVAVFNQQFKTSHH